MRFYEKQIRLVVKLKSARYIVTDNNDVFTAGVWMIYFHFLIGLLILGFLAWQLVWPMRKHKVAAGALLTFLAFGSLKFPLVRVFGGKSFFAPDLPGWVLHLGGFLFGWIIFSFIILIPAAVFFGVWHGYCKYKKRSGFSCRTIRITKWILVGMAAVMSLAALWGGIKAPEVRHIRLSFHDLPVQADGLRIAVLCDIHAGPTVKADRVRKFVELANAAKPDVILLVGDYLDGTVEDVGADLEPLRNLYAPLGVFAVTGNHEYYYDYPRWREFLDERGINMLENRRVKLGDTGIRVAGITDPAGRKFKEPAPNLKRALAGAGEHFTILMSHRPKYAREAAKLGAKLQLSGHTHGGSLWWLQPFVKNFNAGFVSGQYDVNGMTLLVCNGTGIWNGMPLRLGAPSEILLLELHRAQ